MDSSIRTTSVKAGKLELSALETGEAGQGETVLLLHGFPDTLRSFRHQLPVLAEAGFHAVAPALRGYEPDDALDSREATFHVVRVAEDALALADALSPQAPVHLVGHDWGSVAVQLAVAMAPERVRTATVIAVPPMRSVQAGLRRHPRQLLLSSYMLFFQVRGIADRIVAARDFAFIELLWRRWSPGWEWDPDDMAALKDAFRRPGVLRNALSYYRALANPVDSECRALMARMQELVRTKTDVPLLAVTGGTDGCMDTRLFDHIDPRGFPGGLRVERIEGAGHFCQLEKPGPVGDLLLDWLRK